MINNLFNGLETITGEIKTESINENFSIEVSGKFKMVKGNFQQEFSYYARIYEFRYHGYVGIDDWNIDTEKCFLGDLPIDNIYTFKDMLSKGGLTTISNSLGFSTEENKMGMYEVIGKHKHFLKVYGKKIKIWDALTKAEQKLINLDFVIANYDDRPANEKYCFGIVGVDELGNQNNYVPTLEELITLRESLT